jgi:hypothetical protein
MAQRGESAPLLPAFQVVKVLECGVYELCRKTEAGLVWQEIRTTISRVCGIDGLRNDVCKDGLCRVMARDTKPLADGSQVRDMGCDNVYFSRRGGELTVSIAGRVGHPRMLYNTGTWRECRLQ